MALTAYDQGVIRLSMPQVPIRFFEMDDICSALEHCANHRETDQFRRAEHLRQYAGWAAVDSVSP